MTHSPLIGITTYAVNDQGNVPLPHEYVDSVRRAGGVPVLIPPGEARLADIVQRIDGLVLAGGGDICPSRYGGCGHQTIYMINVERDESELSLIRLVLESQLPTLAICRGLQVLNVALGGTLIPHLPDVVGEAVPHRLPPRVPVPHDVTLEPDSRLARVMGSAQIECVSWHHQAVDHAGDGCRIVARAPDGVAEAIELTEHPQLLAVQWHPELSSERDIAQQRLFDELVRMARGATS
ncbi:MAG: gamma-glutamyl-gamma-aminobutyrate hydrolase family protein [Planctomycetales bacterium]|nr:gamma-glutamyl-gamma-aminobutyrate hydrolase family protein [Planctomycetales bacterium]